MRFVSLNAWGGAVWPALSRFLRDADADILCLQEVTRAPVPSPDWLVYEDANRRLDQRSDLFADISRLLPDHCGVFAPAARGPLRDARGREVMSEHGIAFWTHRRLALTGLFHGFAHGAYRAQGWGDEPVPRSLQLARVHDPASGRELGFGHFHGLREQGGKGPTAARRRQTGRVAASLAAFGVDGLPFVLAGDFNLLPEDPFFVAMAGLGLHDLVTGRGHSDTRTVLYAKPVRYADYLLVSDRVPVRDFELPAEPVVSDHRPMLLDIGW